MEKTAMQKLALALEADIARRVDEKLAAKMSIGPEVLSKLAPHAQTAIKGMDAATHAANMARQNEMIAQSFSKSPTGGSSITRPFPQPASKEVVQRAAQRSQTPVIVRKVQGGPAAQMDAARQQELLNKARIS